MRFSKEVLGLFYTIFQKLSIYFHACAWGKAYWRMLLRLRVRRSRLQRFGTVGSRLGVGLLFLVAIRHLYYGFKLSSADAKFRAVKSSAQSLRAMQDSAGLSECFALLADRKDPGSDLCIRANNFLSLLHAAGLVIPLPPGGNLFKRHGICAGACFIATNVRDAQQVMPNYIYHLVLTVGSLTHYANPVFVSVYESGSKDRTADWLQVLGDVLDALSVPHRLELGGNIQREKGEERIKFLARVRSAALVPLFEQCNATGQFCAPSSDKSNSSGRIIFLNDVLFSAADIVRLLQYPADLVCGLDLGMAAEPDMTEQEHQATVAAYLRAKWLMPRYLAVQFSRLSFLSKRWRKYHHEHEPLFRDFGPLFFYDKWVARDISGRMFTNRSPYVVYQPSVDRVTGGRPVRVHCCWNGLAVINAEPFVQKVLDFREHREGECAASECSLLCDDMWRLGYDNIIMDPNVRVTYDLAGVKKLFHALSTELPLGAPGLAYSPFRQEEVRDVMSLPKHDDISRESSNSDGHRTREVDCCDLKKGADMVEFRDPGVCHTSVLTLN
ncbi:hypothetical protein Vafri_17243 [Volvox africanus]|uniref:Uncharacterized protein n=1 Tax=Volvox africanus TaxID=51714 RepID=A0A8J4F6G8_9CHLO|nr:hypothetical protein Vafri_17243 [Volvox africanus]